MREKSALWYTFTQVPQVDPEINSNLCYPADRTTTRLSYILPVLQLKWISFQNINFVKKKKNLFLGNTVLWPEFLYAFLAK